MEIKFFEIELLCERLRLTEYALQKLHYDILSNYSVVTDPIPGKMETVVISLAENPFIESPYVQRVNFLVEYKGNKLPRNLLKLKIVS